MLDFFQQMWTNDKILGVCYVFKIVYCLSNYILISFLYTYSIDRFVLKSDFLSYKKFNMLVFSVNLYLNVKSSSYVKIKSILLLETYENNHISSKFKKN